MQRLTGHCRGRLGSAVEKKAFLLDDADGNGAGIYCNYPDGNSRVLELTCAECEAVYLVPIANARHALRAVTEQDVDWVRLGGVLCSNPPVPSSVRARDEPPIR
jgi:hypothetical protein